MAEPGAELPSCPDARCDGSGWLLDETDVARPCSCREGRISRAKTRHMGSGVPKRFRGVSFDRKPICDLDSGVIREVRGFVRGIDERLDSGSGLWFQGEVGTGKTSLAMLVSLSAIKRRRSVAIYSLPLLLAEIRQTYESDSGSSYLELFARLSEVDLLHLDDLGVERRNEWVLEQLYSIINERWQDGRSIMVTTNREWGELREEIGARTISRLTEICGNPIPVMGDDRRVVVSP